MKAMICPQCGGSIRKISLKENFAVCDYCEAQILLQENQDKIVEIPDETANQNQLTPWEQYRENYRKIEEKAKYNNEFFTYEEEPKPPSSVLPAVIIFLVIGLFAAGGFALLAGSLFSPRPSRLVEKHSIKPTASPTIEYPTTTPLPQINYQVKVQWSGANDMEYYENPQIESAKLPTFDENELKKIVFKNRGVQVKVTIDTSGEVTSAEAISGHPILKEAAVNAAKKTLFNSRQKPTTRILTYYFRLITE